MMGNYFKDKKDNNKLYPAYKYVDGMLKWGYIDENGSFIIPPQFIRAEDFNNGLAEVVVFDWLMQIIKHDGDFLIDKTYESIQNCASDGYLIVRDTHHYQSTLINPEGDLLFQTDGYIWGELNEGLLIFNNNEFMYGYLEPDGDVRVEPRFKKAYPFKDGLALVQLENDIYAVINNKGDILSTYDYFEVRNLSEGLMSYRNNYREPWGYIDINGRIVIEPRFSSGGPFIDGLAEIDIPDNNLSGSKGLINKEEEFIIDPRYNDIKRLGDGLFALGIPIDKNNGIKGSIYSLSEKHEMMYTDFIYANIGNFKDGLASASSNLKTFFINQKGKIVKDFPVVDGFGKINFTGNLIKAEVDSAILYFDNTGKLIWRPESFFKVGRYTVNSKKYRPNRFISIYYPELEGITVESIQNRVNKELKERVMPKLEKGLSYADFDFSASFHLEFYQKDLMVLMQNLFEYPFGAAHPMPIRQVVNINLQNGEIYKLADVFIEGCNYVKKINEIIKQIIEENQEAMQYYDFETIKKNQHFIIYKDFLKVYFDPYEIASYAAGFPEFKIYYTLLQDIINTDGPLWKSFN